MAEDEEQQHENQDNPSRFIRLRGLPWEVTKDQIIDFLTGVNIAGGEDGVYICQSKKDGRNTGEAYVKLETEEDEENSFKHDKESMGHRYIEIFRASDTEADFAMRKPGPTTVIKLRGLPFHVSEDDIIKFFDGLELNLTPEKIEIAMDRKGRASGEAFIEFESPEEAEKTFKKNRELLGHRYIEIFRSSFKEMKSSRNPRGRFEPYDRNARRGGRGGRNDRFGGGGRGMRGNNRDSDDDFDNFGGGGRFNGGGNSGGFNLFNNKRNNFNDGPFNRNGGGMNSRNNFSNNFSNNFNRGGNGNDDDSFCVRMRGLPYYCFENEVKQFFAPLNCNDVEVIYNDRGLHSGSANAYFETHNDAMQAMKKHREKMGERYIELFYDNGPKNNFRRI